MVAEWQLKIKDMGVIGFASAFWKLQRSGIFVVKILKN
jgi:hypothetical protein